jgi:hypothetical protein
MQLLQLLSDVTVGGQKLKNRMVLAPMTRARYVCVPEPLFARPIPNECLISPSQFETDATQPKTPLILVILSPTISWRTTMNNVPQQD